MHGHMNVKVLPDASKDVLMDAWVRGDEGNAFFYYARNQNKLTKQCSVTSQKDQSRQSYHCEISKLTSSIHP